MTLPVAVFLIAASFPAGALVGAIVGMLIMRGADSILKLCGYQP